MDKATRMKESTSDLVADKLVALAERPSPARRSRGPVDAPGKRHRKPLPKERLDKKMGEPSGKQMGQKNFQSGRRSGRG